MKKEKACLVHPSSFRESWLEWCGMEFFAAVVE